jgi:nitrogen PTS system EIIA component
MFLSRDLQPFAASRSPTPPARQDDAKVCSLRLTWNNTENGLVCRWELTPRLGGVRLIPPATPPSATEGDGPVAALRVSTPPDRRPRHAMNIVDILEANAVLDDLAGSTPQEVLSALCGPLARRTGLDRREMVEALLNRERLGSTSLGGGLAVPHAKMPGLHGVVAGLGRSTLGIRFKAPDLKRVRILFALFAPESARGEHLQALARVSRLFETRNLRERILNAHDSAEMYELLVTEDAK